MSSPAKYKIRSCTLLHPYVFSLQFSPFSSVQDLPVSASVAAASSVTSLMAILSSNYSKQNFFQTSFEFSPSYAIA